MQLTSELDREQWDTSFQVELDNYHKVWPIPAKQGMRFLCSKGHVTFIALAKGKRDKRHCSKIVAYGQCLFPVEQIYWRGLMQLAKRSFRAGVNRG